MIASASRATGIGVADDAAGDSAPGPWARIDVEQLCAAVASLTGSLAAAPPGSVGLAVIHALRDIAAVLQIDWAMVWNADAARPAWPQAEQAFRVRLPPPATLTRLLQSPAVVSALDAGAPTCFADRGAGAGRRDAHAEPRPILSAAIVPLPAGMGAEATEGRTALVLGSSCSGYEWRPVVIDLLRTVAAAMQQALARRDAQVRERACGESAWADARHRPVPAGVRAKPADAAWGLIASESPAMQQALSQVGQVAGTSSTVLLLGETGAGKERFARAIHDLSDRGGREMVRVSCAAIPATLIESELFGRERGAYTGALTRQSGRFEDANGSTLFLDEIGELSHEVQVKLLRVLEERVIQRLGSTQPTRVDVRIIAATHRDLEKAVAEGRFREDLFYRLNVFPIRIPPLRERPDDIPAMAWRFVEEFSNATGKSFTAIANDSMRQLMAYSWPGNIRELRNLVERAVILGSGPVLTISMPEASVVSQPRFSSLSSLKDVEITHIRSVLQAANWRIRGAGGAAERLGLKPSTLETRMAKLGLKRPKPA